MWIQWDAFVPPSFVQCRFRPHVLLLRQGAPSLEPNLACMQSKWRVVFRVSLPNVRSTPITAQNNGCRQPCRLAQHWHSRDHPLAATCRPKKLRSHSDRHTSRFSSDYTAFGTSARNVFSAVEHSLPPPLNVFRKSQSLLTAYLTGLALRCLSVSHSHLYRTASPGSLLLETF